MKLETVINHSMMQHPSLYRCHPDAMTVEEGGRLVRRKDRGKVCRRQSRLHVLNHLFLVNGSGMRWHRDGFRTQMVSDGKGGEEYEILEHRELPDGYFERDFFLVEIDEDDAASFRSEFEGSIVYETKGIWSRGKEHVSFFVDTEAPEEVKFRAIERYARTGYLFVEDLVTNAEPRYMDHPFSPYPICEYSGLAQAVAGKELDEGFDLTPQPDWAAGIVEVARETIAYYRDDERSKLCSYHPDTAIRTTYDFQVFKMGMEGAHRKLEVSSREEAYQKLASSFEVFKAGQVAYCERAIARFDEGGS